jgi:hypothetical protein
MRYPRSISNLLLAFLAVLLFNGAVYAQNNRSAVSISGSDANTCTPASPCRSFSYAITQTNATGEIVALDSGGYGAFTVTKAITIQAAPGVYAGVTQTSGDAILISAASNDKVVIRGLTLSGMGTGSSGVAATVGAQEVHVENCVIDGFANYGIITFLNMRVQDTVIRSCGNGIWVDNAGGPVKTIIDHVQVKDISGGNAFFQGVGILCWRNATVLVRNSIATFATTGLLGAGGGQMTVENCLVANNNLGIRSQETNTLVRVSNTMTTANVTGWSNTLQSGFESYGNNRTRGNGTDIGGTGLIPLVPQS